MALLTNASDVLPPSVSEDEALNAAAQFLVTSGTDIAEKDQSAHYLVTKPVTGQTVLSTCRPINQYFVYKFRVSVVGASIFVNADCWQSTGWESDGQVPAHRDALTRCELVSQGDAGLPRMIIDGMLEVIKLRATPRAPR